MKIIGLIRFFVLLLFFILTETSTFPETIQYYEKPHSKLKYITVYINNIPIEMLFDTGATDIILNANAVQALGIKEFLRQGTASTAGGYVTQYSFMASSIRVGLIDLRNIEIWYAPTASESILGASFFSYFNYFIDEENKTITFIEKGKRLYISP